MRPTHISPQGLTKHLVNQEFVHTVKINTERPIKLQLYTNINRSWKAYNYSRTNELFTCSIPLKKSGFFKWRVRYKNDLGWQWLRNAEGKKIRGELQVDPEWIKKSIVYNVFVRFFKGRVARWNQVVKPGEGGTFDDVKSHLDELKKMGINTLYLNPIHLIGELYRKYNFLDQLPAYLQPGSPYSIKDYKSIDPELTYDKDTKKHLMADPQQEFKDLVDAAHERGMYVLMDLVFNHTAHDFVFQRIHPEWYLYKENITSLDDPYFYPQDLDQGKPWGDPKHTVAPYDHGIFWEDAAQLNWEYANPPAPNDPPPNPTLKEMWEYFKSIPQYWINHFGIDGFRCDMAYHVPPEFWKACIAEARSLSQQKNNNLAGDVVFVAESYTNDLKLLHSAGFTAVYGDYSNKLSRPLELRGYLEYIYNLSGDHFPPGSRWFIYPEAHDFGRTPQKILGTQADHLHTALLANQSRWLLTATLPGIPLIFNGFEKIEWEPINLFSYGAIDWERDLDLRNFIAKVNRLRHWYKALQLDADISFLETNQGLSDSTQLLAYLRTHQQENIIVIINMDVHRQAGPTLVYLPEKFNTQYQLTDLLTHRSFTRQGKDLLVELEPGDAHLFKVSF